MSPASTAPAFQSAPVLEHWIDGQLARSSGSRTQAIFNPATGQTLREVALGTNEDVQRAVEVALRAQPAWADTPPIRRARVLLEFLALLNQNRDLIAATITEEHGKVLADASGEVMRGIEIVEYACGIAPMLK